MNYTEFHRIFVDTLRAADFDLLPVHSSAKGTARASSDQTTAA